MTRSEATEAFNERYLAARQRHSGSLSYGLGRRTRMLMTTLERLLPSLQREQLDVVDFGCADAFMLRATAETLGARHGSSTGLDVFRTGVPPDTDDMRFLKVDLFKGFPYPLEDASCDIAIASAFMKHHPDTRRFLEEVARVLRPGGVVVLLDPRPFVVKVGMIFGKFSRHYNPSLWSAKSVAELVASAGIELRPEFHARYWVAPVQSIYDTGIENVMPSAVVNLLALHQCMVLRRQQRDEPA